MKHIRTLIRIFAVFFAFILCSSTHAMTPPEQSKILLKYAEKLSSHVIDENITRIKSTLHHLTENRLLRAFFETYNADLSEYFITAIEKRMQGAVAAFLRAAYDADREYQSATNDHSNFHFSKNLLTTPNIRLETPLMHAVMNSDDNHVITQHLLEAAEKSNCLADVILYQQPECSSKWSSECASPLSMAIRFSNKRTTCNIHWLLVYANKIQDGLNHILSNTDDNENNPLKQAEINKDLVTYLKLLPYYKTKTPLRSATFLNESTYTED